MTTAYTPQQNGESERTNRSLVGAVLSLLSYAKLPNIFWREALHTANHLQNKSPTTAISANSTPFGLWYGQQPNLSYNFKFFGCKAHVLIPKEQNKNWILIHMKQSFWVVVRSQSLPFDEYTH